MAGLPYLALPGPPRMGPTDTDLAKLALATQGAQGPNDRYDSSSDEESDSREYPPGPVNAESSTVGGPGFAGGSAGAPVTFRVQSRDARGTQLKEGSCYVTATVTPGSTAQAGGAFAIAVEIRDNNDGTYSGTYAVPSRGDYQLAVELNAQPVGGSPFPVFFSPPESSPSHLLGAISGDLPGESRGGVPANVSREQLAILASQGPSTFPQISIMGPRAAKAQVDFPTDADTVDRSILVGNLSAAVSVEQLRQLFGFCGSVTDVRFSGDPERFAIIEYGAPGDAERALAMKGMQVIDRNIEVEGIRVASAASGKSDQPYGGLQLHQMAQVQLAQLQQQSLAAQVAQMRAQAKLNPGAAPGKGLPQNSASQKAAALTAIAALSKRLTGGASIASFTDSRGQSPPRLKRRRAVSPTIRYRGDSPRREKSRDRHSPPRRQRSRSRSPSRRGRSGSRGRRDGSRSKRERSRSPQRSQRRSPSQGRRDRRDRDRHVRESERAFRAPEPSSRSDRQSDGRHSSRDGDRGRERDREPDATARGEDTGKDPEREHKRKEHKRRHKSHRHRHEQEEGGPDPTAGGQAADGQGEDATRQQQEAQEAELRLRALNSLKSGLGASRGSEGAAHENGTSAADEAPEA